MKKLFLIRKYVWAETAQQAIKKEKTSPVDDCWIDDEWKRNSHEADKNSMGFYSPKKK